MKTCSQSRLNVSDIHSLTQTEYSVSYVISKENSSCSHSSCSTRTQKSKRSVNEGPNSPNSYIWNKVELLIEQMISEENGIPVRNVKSLMSTIPSTFTGSDVVHWLMEHADASDVAEAVHLASRLASMGYLFCIDDHNLTVKNDNHTYYRFQTPFYYPSRCMDADTVDYAVYLCKRTMQNKQRLELAGFEAERLASLQTLYCHRWEFVYIQAEAEAKVDKKRDKLERLVLDSQERAYWDVHRPPPGSVNTTDIDMRKLCRAKRPKKTLSRPVDFPIPTGPYGKLLFHHLDEMDLADAVTTLNNAFRVHIKTSKAVESIQNFCDQYSEFDLILSVITTPTPSANAPNQSGLSANTGQFGSSMTLLNRTAMASPLTSAMSGSINKKSSDRLFHLGRTCGSGGTAAVYTSSSGLPGTSGATSAAGGHVMSGASGQTAVDGSHESATALNPWVSDNPDYWNLDSRPKSLPIRRIKRWSFSIYELLKDPIGLDEFQRWLEKEFSAENLRFWQQCQELKSAPLREVHQRVLDLYNQYLSPNAVEPLNVDSRIADSIQRHLSNPSSVELDRYCFEQAESHIFHLMKSDSYYRFLRSDYYRELFTGNNKQSKRHRPILGSGGTTTAPSSQVLSASTLALD